MQNLDSVFAGAERTTPNPFLDDVFAPGITTLPGIAEIHTDAMSRCVKAFESLLRKSRAEGAPWGSSGRTILIAAPRAGYGKSHLVGRVRSVTESLVAAVSLPFDPARPVDWRTMLDSVINQYRTARCPQHMGCTLFDEAARFFQSCCVRSAIERGAVDEKEVPESEVAMRVQFRDVFDPKATTRLTSWLSKRSPELIDAASPELCRRWSLAFEDLVFWNRFFQEHTRPKADPFDQLHELDSAESCLRLTQFLRIATDCRPLAFVVDHLDGFFGSDTAGMEIAGILTTLRSEVPRSVTLLCLNEDLWQSTFENRIPSAWIDRLTGEPAALGELSIEAAETLIQSRLSDAGVTGEGAAGFIRQFRMQQGWETGESADPIFPREVLRLAARQWDEAATPTAPSDKPVFPAPPHPEPAESGFSQPEETTAGIFGPREEMPSSSWMGSPFEISNEEAAPSFPSSEPAIGNVFHAPRSLEPQPPQPAKPPASKPNPATPEESAAAAARAAGIDPTRNLTDIEAIIADIRGGGARRVSETARREGGRPPINRVNGSQSKPPASAAGSSEPNPFWAKDLERRLQELEAETLTTADAITWNAADIEHLIQTVGDRFPAVGQAEQRISGPQGGSFLRWLVKNYVVLIAFEAPTNLPYWKTLLQTAASTGDRGSAKIAVFSHASEPFDFKVLSKAGTDSSVAIRYFDVIEVSDGDLALLHAASRFLHEAEAADQTDAAVRVIARRLDPFWRRLTRPLASTEAAG